MVAVDGGGLLLDLCLDGGQFCALVAVAGAVFLLCLGDGVGDELVGVGVEVAQGLERGAVGGGGVEARGFAAVGAVPNP